MMFKIPSALFIFFIVFTVFDFASAEITYIPFSSKPKGIWESDSLYLGAEIAVKDATKPVIVTWRPNHGNALGALYVMVPDKGDSARFLFHNLINEFSKESLDVNIGRYPNGTKLVFMYAVTDTSKKYTNILNKKLYTGQNRSGTDLFISDIKGLIDFRWAVAGKVDEHNCEVSFASVLQGSYRQILFKISNTYLIK